MGNQILDELYEASAGNDAYLGYVQITDHTDLINTETTSHWQPHPSTFQEATRWVDSYEKPNDHCLIDVAGVVSVRVRTAAIKDRHQNTWSNASC